MTGPPSNCGALYAGPDLYHAAEKSSVRASLHDRLAGTRNAFAIAADVVTARLRRDREASYRVLVARGTTDDPGTTITTAYAGTGNNQKWFFSTIYKRYEITESRTVELTDEPGQYLGGADIVVTEGIPENALPPVDAAVLRMPAWVKQRLRIEGNWQRQVSSLRRTTRQEIARILRKYGYGCRLSVNAGDCANFYDRLYRPFVERRFGLTAHIVERDSFLAECRRGVLLQLLKDEEVVGAALLRPLGRTLTVVWSAHDPDMELSRLRGASDAMDYFSLLYAHLKGFRWLEFGPSRPDLYDGVLRYKSKWGCEVHSGLVPQQEMRLAIPRNSPAETEFLPRHAFIVKTRRGLRGLFFVDKDTNTRELQSRLSTAITKGIFDYRVLALSRPANEIQDLVRRFKVNIQLLDKETFFGKGTQSR